MIPHEHHYHLRHLPVAAKVVLSVFLLAVGLGYFSAMVQLHMQHSERNGDVLPSPADVVEVFAGVKRYDPANNIVPACKFEKLIMGPVEGASWNGTGSMAAAFFDRDDSGEYKKTRNDDPEAFPKLHAQRDGERQSLKSWIALPEGKRKDFYEVDKMPRPEAVKDITADYLDGDAIKVKSIITDRCARCHSKGGDQEKFPLETYIQIAKYLDVPKVENPVPGSWITSNRQIGIEKLTQSTHAHLLSFAMLFGLTGFAFAFTSYPKSIRLIIAPLVLIAQVCDVSCWWLARIPDIGPYFAYAILATGTAVGLGLFVQIVGCLFDLFGRKGRFVLIVLGVLAAAGFGSLYVKVIEPGLNAEKAAKP